MKVTELKKENERLQHEIDHTSDHSHRYELQGIRSRNEQEIKKLMDKKMSKNEIKLFESSACEWRDHWIDEEIMDLQQKDKANTLYDNDLEEDVAIKLKILKRIRSDRDKDGGW